MENGKVIDVLMYFVPAIIVLLAAFMLIKKFLDNDYKLKLLEARRNLQKDVIPLRLQAYERMCLFLERISPNNLIFRVHKTGMTARDTQLALLTAIRTEYEHNLSQQIYMSPESWETVRAAKEELIKIVNLAYTVVGEKATGLELSKVIFENIMKEEKVLPTQKALNYIKKEVSQIL